MVESRLRVPDSIAVRVRQQDMRATVENVFRALGLPDELRPLTAAEVADGDPAPEALGRLVRFECVREPPAAGVESRQERCDALAEHRGGSGRQIPDGHP